MKTEFAEQYGVPCLVLDGTERPIDVYDRAMKDGAWFWEPGEDEASLVLRYPGRPQELYTVEAIKRSYRQLLREGN